MKALFFCAVGWAVQWWSHPAAAQAASADTLLLTPESNLRAQYDNLLLYKSSLYNGPEYVNYLRPGAVGHPFWESKEEQLATVEYGGLTYTEVPLRFDVVRGQLVLQSLLTGLNLCLVNERVTRFSLGGHTFVRLAADAGGAPLSPGFYDLLVDGPVQVLGFYRKKIEELTAQTTVSPRNEYFVRKDGRYYRVRKAGTLLSLFPQQKSLLRKYVQANQLTFEGDNLGPDIAALVRYQATLPPTP